MIHRLVIVTAHFPPRMLGGVQRNVEQFAAQAAASGVSEIFVLTTSERGATHQTAGYTVIELPSWYLMGGRFPIPRGILPMLRAYRSCFGTRHSSTVVVAHTRLYLTTFVGAVMARLAGAQFHIIEHGSGHFSYPSPLVERLSAMYEHVATVLLRIFRPTWHGVSYTSAHWLRHFGIRYATVVPNGVPDLDDSRVPARSPADFAAPSLFFAGRLIAEKGVLELLDAFEEIRRDVPKASLVIAGAGPLEGEVARRAAHMEGVDFLGSITPARIAALMRESTVFVNPSNYPEGLPTTILEAGLWALPVITTPRGGSAEVVVDGVSGYLIDRGSPRSIVDSLVRVLGEPAEAVRRGRALRERVRQNYLWPAIVADFLAAFSEPAATPDATMTSSRSPPP